METKTVWNVKCGIFFMVGITYLAIYGCSSSDKPFVKSSQEVIDKERAYKGSVFKELKARVWEEPYEQLPTYKVDKGRINSGEFERNSARTVDAHFDLLESERPKIVHPNGICLTGFWEINDENSDNHYTGYFANGRKGLVLARASSEGDMVQIEQDSGRVKGHLTGGKYISYGLVGKLFPTDDAEDPLPYRPAHFIVQTDLGGQTSSDFSDIEMLNAPDVSAVRRGLVDGGFVGGGVRILARTGSTFEAVDESTTIRQTYEIAELGKSRQDQTNAPKYLKLAASTSHRRKLSKGDFRTALKDYVEKENKISFDIFVANKGRKKTMTQLKQNTIVTDSWKKLGKLTFLDAVASRVCDSTLHFHHPAWREDRNDPNSRVRPEISEE